MDERSVSVGSARLSCDTAQKASWVHKNMGDCVEDRPDRQRCERLLITTKKQDEDPTKVRVRPSRVQLSLHNRGSFQWQVCSVRSVFCGWVLVWLSAHPPVKDRG